MPRSETCVCACVCVGGMCVRHGAGGGGGGGRGGGAETGRWRAGGREGGRAGGREGGSRRRARYKCGWPAATVELFQGRLEPGNLSLLGNPLVPLVLFFLGSSAALDVVLLDELVKALYGLLNLPLLFFQQVLAPCARRKPLLAFVSLLVDLPLKHLQRESQGCQEAQDSVTVVQDSFPSSQLPAPTQRSDCMCAWRLPMHNTTPRGQHVGSGEVEGCRGSSSASNGDTTAERYAERGVLSHLPDMLQLWSNSPRMWECVMVGEGWHVSVLLGCRDGLWRSPVSRASFAATQWSAGDTDQGWGWRSDHRRKPPGGWRQKGQRAEPQRRRKGPGVCVQTTEEIF